MEAVETSTLQQERLQAIAEKRKRQTEIENKRRQLEDDRRQLQHLKSKALRERWLLEGAPSSASKEDEAMKKQMQEDEVKTKELEETIQRLEKELETLENSSSVASTKENLAEVAAVPAKEEKAEIVPNAQKSPLGTAVAKKVSSSPMKAVEGTDMMKAAMYSVEITVEKDRVTGETKVLSSTTLLPQNHCLQGVKVYEDELKVVHAVSAEAGALQNGAHPLSSSEVDELLHKADEVTLSEAKAGEEAGRQRPVQPEADAAQGDHRAAGETKGKLHGAAAGRGRGAEPGAAGHHDLHGLPERGRRERDQEGAGAGGHHQGRAGGDRGRREQAGAGGQGPRTAQRHRAGACGRPAAGGGGPGRAEAGRQRHGSQGGRAGHGREEAALQMLHGDVSPAAGQSRLPPLSPSAPAPQARGPAGHRVTPWPDAAPFFLKNRGNPMRWL
uniref:Paralemmin-1 n=1 Tax=Anas platyrhynchos TaxID=8839 RepID=A0A8B9SUM5_ANAPL